MANEIATYLKYAELQMAAEALYDLKTAEPGTPYRGSISVNVLTVGNDRASKFTETQAAEFVQVWEVVEHKSNTSTGFSGTLFKARDGAPPELLAKYGVNAGELVMSFRSTEFIDDAARDNQATNTLEVKEFGWAFGQIADMEDWYQSLKSSGKIAVDDRFSVTGYSLGGHLATAFNLLHQGERVSLGIPKITATYTFNGAGVGNITGQQSLADVIADFDRRRENLSGHENDFSDADAQWVYGQISALYGAGGTQSSATMRSDAALIEQMRERIAGVTPPIGPIPAFSYTVYLNTDRNNQLGTLQLALERMAAIQAEVERLPSISSGDSTEGPNQISGAANIEALRLDYQLAVLKAKEQTSSYRTDTSSAAVDAVSGRNQKPVLGNFYDIYGSNFGRLDDYSAVANSQWHYGKATPIFIEDQPLMRGSGIASELYARIAALLDSKLLTSNFSQNDFGDTHSLVLIVDSLSVQNTLLKLDASVSSATLGNILRSAANDKADWSTGTQGKTDGNTLESVVNSLVDILGLRDKPGIVRLKGDPDGGTWALTSYEGRPNPNNYTTRTDLQKNLDILAKDEGYQALLGKTTLTLVGASLATKAKTDFSAFLSLNFLSSFVLGTSDPSVLARLKQANEGLAQKWEADANLDANQRAKGLANFSDGWYEDRSAMLTAYTRRNTYNVEAIPGRTSTDYYDATTDTTVKQRVSGAGANAPANKIAFGGEGMDTLTGSDNLQGDRLYGGAGNDILDARGGNDYLEGGRGTDTYTFSDAFDKDTIIDIDGLGKIKINDQELGAIKGVGEDIWKSTLTDNTVVELKVLRDTRSSTGYKLLLSIEGDSSNTITIQNFNLEQARNQNGQGYLGIKFPPPELVVRETEAVNDGSSGGRSFWSSLTAKLSDLAGKVSNFFSGTGKSFTVDLNQPAKAGDTITLHLALDDSALAKAILGDRKVDANGAVITLEEGQTSVSFALVTEGEVTADISGGLSVTYASEGGQTATSNTWGLNVKDDGETVKTFIGDQRALLWGVDLQPDTVVNEDGSVTQDIIAPGDPRYNTYAWSKTEWAADGTLMGGVAEAGFNDVLYGSSENDKIQGLGGNDALDGRAGDDRIEGGDGDDVIGGGEGSDNIRGGAGNDFILSASNLAVAQRVKPDDEWQLPAGATVHIQGNNWGVYREEPSQFPQIDGMSGILGDAADVVEAGDGDDMVITGHGDDRIDGGAGLDMLMGAGGNDVIEGGADRDLIYGDSWVGTGNLRTPAEQHGHDFLDGGEGDDVVIGQGGDDVVYGGVGDDVLLGDYVMSGSPEDASWLLPGAFHGQDYLDGEDGNDAMYGGGRDDVLYGGAGNDNMMGDHSQEQLAGVYHGDDFLDGEDGDDIMAGNGGHDVLYGGSGKDQMYGDGPSDPTRGVAGEFHGDDYLDGEDDDDELFGGGGADILYGGSGNDTLTGDASDLAGDYHGDDYLDGEEGDDVLTGGGGQDTLYGGDGNDTLHGDDDPAVLDAAYHGDDYLDGGDGDDTLTGGGGNDILLGGAGNDLLIGGDGADYLEGGAGDDRYEAGAGEIVVDHEGANSLTLTDGEPYSVSASGADLVLEYDGDSLVIAGALTGGMYSINGEVLSEWLQYRLLDAVNLSTTADYQTVTGGAGGDDLYAGYAYGTLVGGRGNDMLTGGDFFVTMDGGEHDDVLQTGDGGSEMAGGSGNDVLLAGAGVDVLSGGSGDDVIHGGAGDDWLDGGDGNDVIYGGDGNDTLVAGSGRDTLHGGAGLDTYVLGYGTEAVTAFDDSAEGSVIQLDGTGLQLDSLRAGRRNDDLLIEVLGSESRFRIKDYYSTAQTTWSIKDAEGNVMSAQELVDASRIQWDRLRDDLLGEFRAFATASIDAEYAQAGYIRQEDGSWFRSEFYLPELFNQNTTYSRDSRFIHTPLPFGSGTSWETTTSYIDSSNWDRASWSGLGGYVADRSVEIVNESREAADAYVSLDMANNSLSSQEAWARYSWTQYWTQKFSSSWQYAGGYTWKPGVGANPPDPTEYIQEYVRWTTDRYAFEGRWSELTFSNPGATAVAGSLPDYVKFDYLSALTQYNVGEIILSDGDHIVYANGSAVIGGIGDNVIYSAGFAYGGTGSARLIGGRILIAGEGDQYLEGGDTMVVGDGFTTVVGDGESTVLVDPNNIGIDLVVNTHYDDYSVLNRLYENQGVTDWQESYEYGGMYRFSLIEVGEVYFSSMEEARQEFRKDGWGFNWGDEFESLDEVIATGYLSVSQVPALTTIYQVPGSNALSELTPSSWYESNPVTIVTLTANHFSQLQSIFAEGDISAQRVLFGNGLTLGEIQFSWGEVLSPVDGKLRTTLDLHWGYEQGLRVLIPGAEDSIGNAVQWFEFADGSIAGLSDLIQLAPPAPSFNPSYVQLKSGFGHQVMSAQGVQGIDAPALMLGDIEVKNDGVYGLDLLISIGGGQDSLRLVGWYAGRENQSDFLVILNGDTYLSSVELGRLGVAGQINAGDDDIEGTEGHDVLDGGFGNDYLDGLDGNDILRGGAGDDLIESSGGRSILLGGFGDDEIYGESGSLAIGGQGYDRLSGGGANQVIAYNAGDGEDEIYLRNDLTISLGGGLTIADLSISSDGYDAYLHIGESDVLRLSYYSYYGTSNVKLQIIGSDIHLYDLSAILADYQSSTQPSGEALPLADFLTGHLLSVSTDSAIGGALAYEYATVGHFDDLAPEAMRAVLEDVGFGSVAQSVAINHAPVLAHPVGDQAVQQAQAFSLQFDEGIFADSDPADQLQWLLTLADGGPLPGWLTFDAASRTLSGTARNQDVGVLTLLLSVTDSAGASSSQTLTLTVNEVDGVVLLGTDAADVLVGGGGDDRIDGGAGADRMSGGDGGDTYAVDNVRDVVIEAADEGYDLVESTVSVTASTNVEAVVLMGDGNINATGNSLDNELQGNAGNNRLNGGAGADQMAGGAGNDVYVVDDAGDVVLELADEGTDTVQSLVDYTLGANLENLTLTGTAATSGTGNELSNVITGNAAGNTLRGLGGNDTLRGGLETDILEGGEGNDRLDGGVGADQLIGGLGNDVYVVDEAGDVVMELAEEGTDTVQSLVDYTLGANVENLTLTGTAATSGTGNELNNVITGNAAGNTLRGLGGNDTLRGGLEADILEGGEGNDRLDGGAGADQLAGGLGNDTYVVDELGDVVLELADEGTDTAQSLVDYTLVANLENLTLTGTAATSGTGNELNNVITGNAAGNTLRGLGGNDTLRGGLEADILEGGEGNDRLDGGVGADQLIGGLGNDVYMVDDAGDVVLELAAEGTDTVQSLVDYTLGANLENLTLTGTAATSGTGNELSNVITGNAAGNTLRGLGGNDTLRGGLEADALEGGEGNDRLEGRLGADTYLFSRGEGQDTVVDTDATMGVSDVLQFGADISAEQIWLRKSGNHLEISLLGTTDKVTVANWYLGEDRRVEVLQLASGQQLLDTQVQNLVQAMAAFAPPAAGQTTLPENYATTLAPVIAANWQ